MSGHPWWWDGQLLTSRQVRKLLEVGYRAFYSLRDQGYIRSFHPVEGCQEPLYSAADVFRLVGAFRAAGCPLTVVQLRKITLAPRVEDGQALTRLEVPGDERVPLWVAREECVLMGKASRMLGVDNSTFSRWVAKDKVCAYDTGKEWFCLAEDVRRLAQETKVGPHRRAFDCVSEALRTLTPLSDGDIEGVLELTKKLLVEQSG